MQFKLFGAKKLNYCKVMHNIDNPNSNIIIFLVAGRVAGKVGCLVADRVAY